MSESGICFENRLEKREQWNSEQWIHDPKCWNRESFVFGLLTTAELDSGFCAEVKTINSILWFLGPWDVNVRWKEHQENHIEIATLCVPCNLSINAPLIKP